MFRKKIIVLVFIFIVLSVIGGVTSNRVKSIKGDDEVKGGAKAWLGAGDMWKRAGDSVHLANPNYRVGIGTSSPAYKLDVQGTGRYTGKLTIGAYTLPNTDGSANYVLKTDGAGNVSWQPDETGGVPSGIIVMWSGTIASIPSGWALCDGTLGTPDLRDKFILCVQSGENPGATGGAHFYTLTVAQLPPHNHTGTTNSAGDHTHSATCGSAGDHSHSGTTNAVDVLSGYYVFCYPTSVTSYQTNEGFSAGSYWKPGLTGQDWYYANLVHSHTFTTGTAGAHTHTITISTAGAHTHTFTTNNTGSGATIDNRPAYYKLAFIMKL